MFGTNDSVIHKDSLTYLQKLKFQSFNPHIFNLE